MDERFDIAIIGAGMAGASLAASLVGQGRLALIEAEGQAGYHTTGRSAAFWTESYGGPGVQPLTSASGQTLPDRGFLSPRAALTIGQAAQEGAVRAFAGQFSARGVAVELLDRAGIARMVPGIRPEWTIAALEPSCCDIDVAGLHHHYLGAVRAQGGTLMLNARAAARRKAKHGGWRLTLADGRTVACGLLVNAAGAWADDLARMAGVTPLGIRPLRRTMVQLGVTPDVPASLPLVLDIGESFYFKPEGGGLWLSPPDETPSPPCDAAPEEIDVAIAVDRLEKGVDWRVYRVAHRWAGLRSFAPDRLPVYGFDPGDTAFFWFAGQGGFGIQTAPAAARLAADAIIGRSPGEIDPAPYAPARFR